MGETKRISRGGNKSMKGREVNINLIKNIFVEGMNEHTYEELINTFVICSNPEKLKAVIINVGYLKISNIFNEKKQLLIPIVTDVNKAVGALIWAVNEMIARYKLFEERSTKDLKEYNLKLGNGSEETRKCLPELIIVIDDYSIIQNSDSLLDANEAIKRLVMNGEKTGMYIVIGSRYKVEDTEIEDISKYVKRISDREFNNILNQM